MKKIVLACCFLIFFPAAFAATEESVRFSAVIDDLPLMGSMYELPDEKFVFDTASGRIAGTTTTTGYNQKKVTEFYSKALPELGWSTRDHSIFYRENEALTLKMHSGDEGTIVHFSLTPADQRKKRK